MEKVTGSSPVLPTIIMYTVYVLESLKDESRYIGCTSKDITQRVLWHNQGSNRYTKYRWPLKLVYVESFDTISKALARERFFKTGNGRRVLGSLIKQVGARAHATKTLAGVR